VRDEGTCEGTSESDFDLMNAERAIDAEDRGSPSKSNESRFWEQGVASGRAIAEGEAETFDQGDGQADGGDRRPHQTANDVPLMLIEERERANRQNELAMALERSRRARRRPTVNGTAWT
jgi:hypothetical protein